MKNVTVSELWQPLWTTVIPFGKWIFKANFGCTFWFHSSFHSIHQNQKNLALWHYYKVEIRFLSLDFTTFSSKIKIFWLFDTIIRLEFEFWAWILAILAIFPSFSSKIKNFLPLSRQTNDKFGNFFSNFQSFYPPNPPELTKHVASPWCL